MNLYNSKRSQLSRLLPHVMIMAVSITGLLVFQASRFHLVNITPGLKAVTILTSSVSFNYSSKLSETGIRVSSGDKIISSFSVRDKRLVVSLNSIDLNVGEKYTITVGPLIDIRSRKLAEKTYSFKVVGVSLDELSKSQRAAIIKQQDSVTYTRSSINYFGLDVLTNNGLSANQLEDVKQAFFLYSNSIKHKISQVTVLNDSLMLGPYNSNDPDPVSSSTFSIKIDNIELGAKLVYSGLSSAELYLYDQVGGKQLFDSGLLTLTNF